MEDPCWSSKKNACNNFLEIILTESSWKTNTKSMIDNVTIDRGSDDQFVHVSML
jgi:hypothetical protein